MQFEEGYIYHIFNQGNNRQRIFFNRGNYLYFLRKVRVHLLPFVDILAYCLMPNHFHFMVFVKKVEVEEKYISGATFSRALNMASVTDPDKKITLNHSVGILLASYTRAINNQQKNTGSLFRKRTKAECVNCPSGLEPSFIMQNGTTVIDPQDPDRQYPQVCFNYIHHNPVKAGLVKKETDWEFSSARDYAGLRNGSLVNKKVAGEYLEL